MHLSISVTWGAVRSKAVVLLLLLLLLLKLFIVGPIVCGGSVFCHCFVMQYLMSIILIGKREPVADYNCIENRLKESKASNERNRMLKAPSKNSK